MWDCDLHTSANGSWRAVLNSNPDMWHRKAEKNTAMAINSHISDSFNYEGYFGLWVIYPYRTRLLLKLCPPMQTTVNCCYVVSLITSNSGDNRFKP